MTYASALRLCPKTDVQREWIDMGQKSQKEPLRIIDLPGVRELEDRLLIYSGDQGRCEDLAALVSHSIFGIADRNTRFEAPSDLASEMHYSVLARIEAGRLEYEHEANFGAGDDLTDDEIVEVMDDLGFDFRDDRGQPLRCTKLLCRAAEAAAKGIAGGRMPERSEAELTRFEDMLKRSRSDFLAAKRPRR